VPVNELDILSPVPPATGRGTLMLTGTDMVESYRRKK
jgi:hypothetical protein